MYFSSDTQPEIQILSLLYMYDTDHVNAIILTLYITYSYRTDSFSVTA